MIAETRRPGDCEGWYLIMTLTAPPPHSYTSKASFQLVSISLKNVYDTCVYCDLKTKKSPAHIFYKCMASLQCEYVCELSNDY